jgi:hypothetical protein
MLQSPNEPALNTYEKPILKRSHWHMPSRPGKTLLHLALWRKRGMAEYQGAANRPARCIPHETEPPLRKII